MMSIHSSSPPNRYQMYNNVKSLKSSKALNNFNKADYFNEQLPPDQLESSCNWTNQNPARRKFVLEGIRRVGEESSRVVYSDFSEQLRGVVQLKPIRGV